MKSGRDGEADRLRVNVLIGQMDVDAEASLRHPRRVVGAGVIRQCTLGRLLILVRAQVRLEDCAGEWG